jgi:hypothetical protein
MTCFASAFSAKQNYLADMRRGRYHNEFGGLHMVKTMEGNISTSMCSQHQASHMLHRADACVTPQSWMILAEETPSPCFAMTRLDDFYQRWP